MVERCGRWKLGAACLCSPAGRAGNRAGEATRRCPFCQVPPRKKSGWCCHSTRDSSSRKTIYRPLRNRQAGEEQPEMSGPCLQWLPLPYPPGQSMAAWGTRRVALSFDAPRRRSGLVPPPGWATPQCTWPQAPSMSMPQPADVMQPPTGPCRLLRRNICTSWHTIIHTDVRVIGHGNVQGSQRCLRHEESINEAWVGSRPHPCAHQYTTQASTTLALGDLDHCQHSLVRRAGEPERQLQLTFIVAEPSSEDDGARSRPKTIIDHLLVGHTMPSHSLGGRRRATQGRSSSPPTPSPGAPQGHLGRRHHHTSPRRRPT